jgi:hypothetical protein
VALVHLSGETFDRLSILGRIAGVDKLRSAGAEHLKHRLFVFVLGRVIQRVNRFGRRGKLLRFVAGRNRAAAGAAGQEKYDREQQAFHRDLRNVRGPDV